MKKTRKLPSNFIERRKKPPIKDDYKLIFTVIEGSEVDFGKVYDFSESCVSIGRDKSNDIAVHDEQVSRNHCRVSIVRDDGRERIMIEDLASTNGTFVNGKPIKSTVLKTADRIELGSTIIRFDYSDVVEEKYRARLYNLAAMDGLTGLYNKRFLMNKLESQNRIAVRNQRRYSLILIDIDNFKSINDRYGHPAGDEYLKMFAHIITHMLRDQDIGGRFGGEEFLVILPETDLGGAFSLSERIRRKIEESKLVFHKNMIQSTISAGVAQFPVHGKEPEQLIKKADEALYLAKRRGKNQVAVAERS